VARIALDIDSTLHHYWDLFEKVVQDRYGVAVPYHEQTQWGVTVIDREKVHEAVLETHSEENIMAGEPYPGAVETVRAWHEAGHWIHVTSHRALECHPATARWLGQIGMPFDDLHCSYDKVTRCVELGIDVLVDDSPLNLRHARERGIRGATLIHPWNEELLGEEGMVLARDWAGLRELLEPLLQESDA
jgi:FMN phosphatase YigB (HAD superfamily)